MGTKNIGLVAEALVKVGDGSGTVARRWSPIWLEKAAWEVWIAFCMAVFWMAEAEAMARCISARSAALRSAGAARGVASWFERLRGVGGRVGVGIISGETELVDEELVEGSWWRGVGNWG